MFTGAGQRCAMAIPPVSALASVRAALERASETTGADFSLLMETARRESSFNASAKAPTSSATGLFQFVERTWLDTVRRHGADHGLGEAARAITLVNGRPHIADPEMRRAVLALRRDPELSARMAGELAQDNAAFLQSKLGRAPTNGEIYAAHVMGAGGALRLIEAAKKGAPDASTIFPAEARANPWLFTDNGAPRSAQALLDRLNISGVRAAAGRADAARIDRTPENAQALGALMDMMFQDLVRDWLGDLSAGSGPDLPRAYEAYLRAQKT